MENSIILNTDSYKCSQFLQYPANTTDIYSYIESRGGRYPSTVFFGLQMFIKEYLTKPITQDDIDLADEIITAHGEPFNREGWEYILNTYNGYLPLTIKAVPEGTSIATNNVLVTVESTDANCAWLTSYVETALLRAVWYPTTVATNSYVIKQIILDYLEKSGTPESIDFKLHDFGYRGVSSKESAGLGGCAHLVNFMGTDTIEALLYARKYYNEKIAGYSIPASEHSTITSWGRNNEVDAYRNMIKQFGKPGTIFACVSDSYNIFDACDKLWGTELKDEVIASGATLVVRPDSGDPVVVVRKVIEILGQRFGYTTNSKGFKVLNNVRVIQGDGINELSVRSILGSLIAYGWSADNIAFGMGGALLGAPQRDDQKFAMKCSSACVNGEWIDVYKDPITDSGKKSKAGRVTLWSNGTKFVSAVNKPDDTYTEALVEVFNNGKLLKEYTFAEVRQNAKA